MFTRLVLDKRSILIKLLYFLAEIQILVEDRKLFLFWGFLRLMGLILILVSLLLWVDLETRLSSSSRRKFGENSIIGR
jgi:hypothetical protein